MRAPCLALAAAMLALSAPGAAAAAALADRRVLVEVAGRAIALDYAERGAGDAVLDRETGIVPTVDGAVEVRAGPAAVRASASVGGTTIRYTGHVQSGSAQLNGLPISSTSAAHLTAAGAELALAIPYARGIALVAGAAWRRWDRTIHGTTVVSRAGVTVAVAGLSERYAWSVLGAGLRAPLVSADGITWDVEGRITRTVRPAVTVATDGGDVRLALGARWGHALASTLRVALGPVMVARLGFSLERWDFGESGAGHAGWWEPRSTTAAATCELGVGVGF